jgi:hypothetical protein
MEIFVASPKAITSASRSIWFLLKEEKRIDRDGNGQLKN